MCQPLLCTPAESLRVATAAKTPEVVDLSGADSDSESDSDTVPTPGGRCTSSASTCSLLSCDHLPGSDEEEKDVVARLALEDWEIVEGLVGPGKTLLDSALSRIILPYHITPPNSRRGGRRGAKKRRESEKKRRGGE